MTLLGLESIGTGPPLVWLHGFTQTKHAAPEFRSILTERFEVLTIDLPGHGENAEVSANLTETAELLADLLPREPLVIAGYSMGSRVALHFALQFPERVRGIATIGTTRGIQNPAERAARRERDEQLASRIRAIGFAAFLTEWRSQEMFAQLPIESPESRSHSAEGLARALEHLGTGTQEWLGEKIGNITVPFTTLAGTLDTKFATEAAAIAETVPEGTCWLIENALHPAHLEKPDVAATLIRF
jgi:2-succinyl-6-hydroxy-2,4-cyclohexadiene-1-carboxylate synthase